MKKALVVMLAVLLAGAVAWAKTDYFDGITASGAVSFTGTMAFSGTTLAFSPSTSFIANTPDFRIGYDAGSYIKFAVADTTGGVTITHGGNATAVDWTVTTFGMTNATSHTVYTPSWVLGYDAGASMTIAVSDTTGNVAFSHTGSTKDISWVTAGATSLTWPTTTVTAATSFTTYTPSWVLGYDSGAAVTWAVSDTTGNVAITQAGSTKNLSWTTTGAATFDFGSLLLNSAILTMDSGATLDNTSAADRLTVTEDKIGLTGAVYVTGALSQTGSYALTGTIGMKDDQALTLGTTTATAATKITAEFDETTFGIGTFNIGSVAVPQILNANPTATVIPMVLNVQQSTGAGDLDDYVGFYNKIDIIGAGDATVTAVADASRAYVGLTGGSNNSVASQAYASQPWAKHEGTGAITAMSALSAKLDVSADNFTATTINAGHFHIEGAATVTSTMFDGVMIEVYPDVTDMDAGLRIAVDTGAVVADGIAMVGVATDGIDLSGATLTNDIVLHHGGTIVNTAGVTTITDTSIVLEGAAKTNSLTIDDGNSDVIVDSDNQTAALPTINIPDFVDATADFLVTNTFTTTLPFAGGLRGEDTDGAGTNGGGLVGGAPDITTHTYTNATDDVFVLVYDFGTTTWDALATSALLTAGADWAANWQLLPDADAEEAGDAFAVGMATKFCEVVFDDLATAAGALATWGGNGGKWQYSTGAGTWSDLTVFDNTDLTAYDGLRSLQRTGAITFVPPADWVAATYDGQAAYWVQYVITAAQLTQTPLIDGTNHDEPFVAIPNADTFSAPFKLEITKVRVTNMGLTVHDQAIVFIVGNFTDMVFSAAQTWTASQLNDKFTLGTAIAADPGDLIGILITNDTGSTVNPIWAVEFEVTYED